MFFTLFPLNRQQKGFFVCSFFFDVPEQNHQSAINRIDGCGNCEGRQ